MIQNSLDILTLSGEAALCTRGSVIRYANAPALALLGQDCVGRTVREVFGEELNAVQSAGFLTDFTLRGRNCVARFARMEKGYLIFLSAEEADLSVLNDPMLFSLRSCLMNMGIVADSLRAAAEQREDDTLLRHTASMTGCYFRLMRQVENAGFVLNLLRNDCAFNPCRVDLGEICRCTAEALSAFFPRVEIETALDCEAHIAADPLLFKQMLSNLLDNCLVHADCTHIRLRLSETPNSLLLSVTDDGCGIPQEALHQTFDRYRYHFDAGQMGRGAGLGLSVARGVARLHGGALMLESRPGKGTAVRVTLSRNLACAGQLHQHAEGSAFSTRDLLAGFADCLPEEAFSEKYLD